MRVRITFRSEIYIEGDNIQDVAEKFQAMPLFSADALEEGFAEYIELVTIEDDESGKDLKHEYNSVRIS